MCAHGWVGACVVCTCGGWGRVTVCVWVGMYVGVRVYMWVYVWGICTHVCIYVYVYVCGCMWWMYVDVRVYVHVWMYVCIRTYVCRRVVVRARVCTGDRVSSLRVCVKGPTDSGPTGAHHETPTPHGIPQSSPTRCGVSQVYDSCFPRHLLEQVLSVRRTHATRPTYPSSRNQRG